MEIFGNDTQCKNGKEYSNEVWDMFGQWLFFDFTISKSKSDTLCMIQSQIDGKKKLL